MKNLLVGLLAVIVIASLSGCGTANLFSGLAKSGAVTSTASAQTALDNGDYSKAKEEAAALISSSDPEVQKVGRLVSAEATLGSEGVSMTKIVASIEAISQSGGSDLSSLQKTVPSTINATAVADAAYAIIDTGTTDEDKKTTAGIAAGVAAAAVVTNTFDYNGDGTVDDADFVIGSKTNAKTGATTTVSAAKVTADWVALNDKDKDGTIEAGEKGSVTDLIKIATTNAGSTLGGDTQTSIATINTSITEINTTINKDGTIDPGKLAELLNKK